MSKDEATQKLIQHVMSCDNCRVDFSVYVSTECDVGMLLSSHVKNAHLFLGSDPDDVLDR